MPPTTDKDANEGLLYQRQRRKSDENLHNNAARHVRQAKKFMCWVLRISFEEMSEVLQSLEARGKRHRREGNLFHNANPAGDYLDS